MLAKDGKDGDFGSDDEDDYASHMGSNEDISQKSLTSAPGTPNERLKSTLTSPSTNMEQELEKLLLEEARKQGIFDVDAVNLIF